MTDDDEQAIRGRLEEVRERLEAQEGLSPADKVAIISEGLELIQEWLANRRRLRTVARNRRWRTSLRLLLLAVILAALTVALFFKELPRRR